MMSTVPAEDENESKLMRDLGDDVAHEITAVARALEPVRAAGGLKARYVFADGATRIDALTATNVRRFRQADGGIAAAMALGGTLMPPDANFALSFNLATYRGQQGFSGSAVARLSERVWVSGGFAGSTVKGSTGGRVGMTFGW